MSATIAAQDIAPSLDEGINAATAWLYREQAEDGYWVGMLQSNCCMEAQWLLAMHFLSYEHPHKQKIVQTLLNAQREHGAWEIYYDAPDGDINTTVECYAALRANGFPPNDGRLRKARDWIFAHGGLSEIRVFTRYWLALIGEWPWEKTPNLPPEAVFFPKWFPFSIYNFASWARATILPLTILSARHVGRPLPPECRLDELFPDGREQMNYDLPSRSGFLASLLFYGKCMLALVSKTRSEIWFHTGSRSRGSAMPGMDHTAPGRRRCVGRDSTPVDLQPHGPQY